MKRLILALLITCSLSVAAEATPRFFFRDSVRERLEDRRDFYERQQELELLRERQRLERLREIERLERRYDFQRFEQRDHRPTVQFFIGRDGRLYIR